MGRQPISASIVFSATARSFAIAFETLKATALDRFGRVDIIMNNAGGMTRGLPEHVPLEEWRRVLDINLLSVVRSNLAFLPI